MGVKISELPVASALAGTEAVPVVQSAETRKATVADIAPVRSVAGKTGAVALDPADCGAAATIHTHAAIAITNTPAGSIVAVTVQAAIDELESEKAAASHTHDYAATSHTHPATSITNTPAGTLAATTVQAALDELDSEKAAASHTHVAAEITDLAASGYPANLISSPVTVPADTSYIVMGELRIESDFTNNGNVGIL